MHSPIIKLAKWGSAAHKEDRPTMYFSLIDPDGKNNFPIAPDGRPGRWRYGENKVKQLLNSGLVEWGKKDGQWMPYEKEYAPSINDASILKERSIFYDLVENTEGSNELTEIFGIKDVFDNPKPSDLLRHLMILTTNGNDIILDFFSGSCTLAHAVYKQNIQDESNRKFICIQLPELCDRKSKTYEAGYKTIAEIGKERIRRVIKKLKSEQKDNKDLGFKVFKLAESNFKNWKGVKEDKPEEYIKQMKMFSDPLKSKWNEKDVIYEIAIKDGYGLNIKIEKLKNITKNNTYKVTDSDKNQFFYICLDKTITLNGLSPLELTRDHMFICRDVALSDDTAANLALQCRLKTI